MERKFNITPTRSKKKINPSCLQSKAEHSTLQLLCTHLPSFFLITNIHYYTGFQLLCDWLRETGNGAIWVGISSADPFFIRDHFVQFIHYRRSFLQLFRLCSIWVVWHEWNSRIFKANESTIHQLLDKIKVHSLWSMKV
jgi:hypothetical protein